jgi:serine/threonine protein kinase
MHRDLKMTNVLMSSQGVARLVDFGLSSKVDGGEDGESVQRALDYATLEKGTGVPRDDPRSDLYFLGTIYYELLTGIAPLEKTRDRNERGRFSRYQEVRPVRSVEPGLPAVVANVCDRLMQINPQLRYQNTGEVLRDVRAALSELAEGQAPGWKTGSGVTTIDDAARKAATPAARTVMCIEDRPAHQDMLRTYLTKHGFRVLMVGDLARGLNRIKTSPPDCLVIMAEAAGEASLRAFREVQHLDKSPALTLLIVPESQADWKTRVQETPAAQVLVQPVTLRRLRQTLNSAFGDNNTAEETADDKGGGEEA